MPRTAVALFQDVNHAESVIREIEDIGFARNQVPPLDGALDFGKRGVSSIATTDFELALTRELKRIGATQTETTAYVDGVRHNEVLVFATGPSDRADAAMRIMKRSYALRADNMRRTGPGSMNMPVEAGPARSVDGCASGFTW